jgi:hypothetical protein
MEGRRIEILRGDAVLLHGDQFGGEPFVLFEPGAVLYQLGQELFERGAGGRPDGQAQEGGILAPRPPASVYA